MNNAKRLPDAYAKTTDSNNYKILQLNNLLYNDLRCDLLKIEDSRGLKYASGKTLDRYGEMFNVKRKGDSDDKYRIRILSKIGQYISTGDCNSIIKIISDVFGIEVENISVADVFPLGVYISNISIELVESVGFETQEVVELINSFLPCGVHIANTTLAGSFKFGTHEGESSDTTGYNYGTLGKII